MSIIKPPYRKLKLWLIGSATFLCLYALAGFFLVPWLITSQTPSLIKENLGRDASLKEAKFNPFTLELDLNGFEMLEHDNQRFASFDRFYVNYGLWDTITHLSVAVQQVLLDKPYGHIDILKDGTFNFSDLSGNSEDEPEEVEEDRNGLFPVWVGDLAVGNGAVKFEDHSLKTAFSKEIKDLNLHLKGLTTKKDGNTPYQLGLDLGSESKITLSGDATLDPLKAEGDVHLSELSMPKVWEYLRDSVDFEMQKGRLDLNAHFVFDGTKKENMAIKISKGLIALKDFNLTTTSSDATQLDLSKLELGDIGVDVLSNAQAQTIGISIPSINADNTLVHIKGNDPLNIVVPKLSLTDTGIDINTDETKETAIKINNQQLLIADFGLQTSGLRELFVKTKQITFDKFDMDIVSSEQPIMLLNNQKILLKSTTIGSTKDNIALIDVPGLNVDKLAVDIEKQTLKIDNVGSSQATINSWLAKNGVLNLQTLFAGKSAKNQQPKNKENSENSTKPEWMVNVTKLALVNYRFDLEDRNTKPAARLQLNPINLSINQFSTDFSKPFQVALNTGINQSGNFSTKGSVAIAPLNTKLNITASKLALRALQPYVNDFARLKMKNGYFNMKGKLDLSNNKYNKTVGSFKGDANIAALHTVNTINKKDFLKWKAFNVNGIAFNFEPMKLAIRNVVTDKLYSRVIINKDKTTNISEIFPSEEKPESVQNKTTAKQQNQANSDTMPLKIGAVKIKNGAALFSDLSLIMPFALNMTDLNGAINNISSSTTQTASVRIDGKVNRISPVVIDGSLKPFDIEKFMDIKLNLDDVDLTAITPYMAHFAGYAIEKGKINLDVEYKINDKALQAKNNVVIDQLTLGDEIESPDAVSLPVKLAIGLLQDNDGVIDLNLPMQGSLDDPEFSVGALIGKVLINLLTKAATSPFSLIGGLAGSDDNLSGIVFSAGMSTLDSDQLEKLKKITEALKSRPKLKVEIKGLALTETDRLGLKENRLLSRMQNKKWKKIKGDDNAPASPDQVELSEKDTKKMIVDFYLDDIPDAESPETTNDENGDDIIPEDYYLMARKKLIDQIQVTGLELQELAQNRASIIAHQLIKIGELPASRVFVLKENVQQQLEPAEDREVTIELALSSS